MKNNFYILRKDIKIITDLMKFMNVRNCYDQRNGKWYKGDKDEALNEGIAIIKSVIIDLGEKYKKQIENGEFKKISKEEYNE